MEFDGAVLHFPGWREDRPAKQAAAQARWLTEHLCRAIGAPVSVRAVIALPGWYVVATSQPKPGQPLAINPKSAGFMLNPRNGTSPLDAQQINAIAYQVEQLCRLATSSPDAGRQ